jgi:hypothetical protein
LRVLPPFGAVVLLWAAAAYLDDSGGVRASLLLGPGLLFLAAAVSVLYLAGAGVFVALLLVMDRLTGYIVLALQRGSDALRPWQYEQPPSPSHEPRREDQLRARCADWGRRALHRAHGIPSALPALIEGLAYFALVVLQVQATRAAIHAWFEFSEGWSTVTALLLGPWPVLGTVATVFGAVLGWGWTWPQALVVVPGLWVATIGGTRAWHAHQPAPGVQTAPVALQPSRTQETTPRTPRLWEHSPEGGGRMGSTADPCVVTNNLFDLIMPSLKGRTREATQDWAASIRAKCSPLRAPQFLLIGPVVTIRRMAVFGLEWIADQPQFRHFSVLVNDERDVVYVNAFLGTDSFSMRLAKADACYAVLMDPGFGPVPEATVEGELLVIDLDRCGFGAQAPVPPVGSLANGVGNDPGRESGVGGPAERVRATDRRVCDVCGKPIQGTVPKLVTRVDERDVLVRCFCSGGSCAEVRAKEFAEQQVCVWCGRRAEPDSWKLGGLGEPYCSPACYSDAGRAMTRFEIARLGGRISGTHTYGSA